MKWVIINVLHRPVIPSMGLASSMQYQCEIYVGILCKFFEQRNAVRGEDILYKPDLNPRHAEAYVVIVQKMEGIHLYRSLLVSAADRQAR